MKRACKIILTFAVIFLFAVVSYLSYMHFSFYRIEDGKDLTGTILNQRTEILKTETEYSVLTYNLGFGAHDKEFSFFMDRGTMKDGSKVRGTMSVAKDKETVLANVEKMIKFLTEQDTDFVITQEVDSDSTRGFRVNQYQMIADAMEGYASVFDKNLHVPYLMYPITDPHGFAESGLLSFSKYRMDSAVHRKLFINEGFIERFVDLDRCFTVMRFPVEEEKELVLLNLHLSAYDKGGSARKEQLKLLNAVMKEEYEKGNYVILGGDFNHTLSDSYKDLETQQEKPKWVFSFPTEELTEHFRIIHASNSDEVGTCRSSDLPYREGINYRARIDGFIVSDNIEASSEIIDEKFEYTDHNPVKLKFTLKK